MPITTPLDPELVWRRQLQRKQRRQLILQVVLFLLTIVSTSMVGGVAYSAGLIGILLCHEMGHYFAARRYRVDATLPFFIPFPFNLFGTFGAVIKLQGAIPNRKALFDIGIMGPALGVVIALPATIIGIMLSHVTPITAAASDNMLSLGDSLIFMFLSRLIHGHIPEGSDLMLHPLGFAGWAGLFVTALNLLPIGQLDGGHIIYAIFQKRSLWIYRAVFILFAIVAVAINRQWLFFVVLVYFLTRLKHPPTLDDNQPLGRARVIYGILALLFFLLTFPPIPIKM
jgi:membrane-associated protease RseP (regulator of RpoE activity)